MNTRQLKNSGTALPLVLVVIILLLVMGTTILAVGLNSRLYSLRTASEISARTAADAGLTKALFEMNQKLAVRPWNDSTLPQAANLSLTSCNAQYSYVVTGSLAGGYIITSVGQSGGATRTVSASLGIQGVFNQAILTKNGLVLKSGTIIDGYNSSNPLDTDILIST